jgi:hypothetical protein
MQRAAKKWQANGSGFAASVVGFFRESGKLTRLSGCTLPLL